MVLVLKISEETWHDVFHNAPEWDKLTPGGTPGGTLGKKRPKKKNSSKGIKKFKKR